MSNALVAPTQSSTTWYTGLGLVEDAAQLSAGIQNHSWVDDTLGAVGGGLDTLGMVVDPLGSLASWGASWLMEHVKPLKDALNWLAGNPDEVAAHAATWANVAKYAEEARHDYDQSLRQVAQAWQGASAEAYRAHAGTHLNVLDGISRAAQGISYGVQGAGMLVGMVRGFVRDLIAQFVATLAVRLPEWLAEEGVTLGLATPVVVTQVVTLVAEWVSKIQRFVRALLDSLRRLTPMLHRLGEILQDLKALLSKLARANPLTRRAEEPRSLALTDVSERGHGTTGHVDLTAQPLTDTDRVALHDYTTNDGYTTMNPFLRDSSGYSEADKLAIQARADRVSDGLAKLPAEPGTTYRGVQFSDDILARYNPGDVVTENAFTSTTRDPAIVQGAFNGNTVMSVIGQNGKDVAPFSQYAHEAEILFDKGTRFQVTGKSWNSTIGKWVIKMEEV